MEETVCGWKKSRSKTCDAGTSAAVNKDVGLYKC